MSFRKMKLRPYQEDALQSVLEHFRTHQRTVAVLPTGTGKTILFAALADRMVRRGGRAMVLAHREELIDQAADKIGKFCGMPVDVEMADRRASQIIKAPIVVSSIQTQTAGSNGQARMRQFDPGEFSLVVADECHHAAADTWRRTLEHYGENPNCRILGVTATPKRTDRLALGSVFDSTAFNMGLIDGIREGWLVPIDQRYVVIDGLDYGSVKLSRGDFAVGDLAECMERILEATAAAILERCEGTTLVFCVDVAHAEDMTQMLNQYRPGYAHLVTGQTPTQERRLLIDDFRQRRYPCLVNCMIATEGFDVPPIRNVVMARPTKSALLYEQMLGRGTRPTADVDGVSSAAERLGAIAHSDKPDMRVFDFVGNSKDHEIVRAIDVLGGNMPPDLRARIEQILEREGGGDVMDAERRADEELQAERASRHARSISKDEAVSPFGKNDPFAAFGIKYEPGTRPIEDWQREKLEKWRMPIPENAEAAQALIDEVRSRTRRGLCTFRMVRMLERNGFRNAKEMAFEEASREIDKLRVSQGWKQ